MPVIDIHTIYKVLITDGWVVIKNRNTNEIMITQSGIIELKNKIKIRDLQKNGRI